MERKENLTFKDNKGNIGEGQTLTDLAANTIAINKMRRDIAFLWLLTLFLIFMFFVYIARHNILTNSLRMLGGC